MLIIPAIDLRGGRCVRLTQGDFTRETVYDDDPARVAAHWAGLGATWLHVVDLDGARAGEPRQLDLVRAIAAAGAAVELGGGIRTLEHLAEALAAGASRVVIGTAAIEEPDLLAAAVRRYGGERVVLGVDARGGRVAVRGWEQVTDVAATMVIARARDAGVERVIYTDIERDGTLTSPNFREVAAVARLGLAVIASGGVASREHLARLAEIEGVEAAIVGRAMYTGGVVVADRAGWWIAPVGAGRDAGAEHGGA